MSERTPLEMAFVDAETARLAAEDFDKKAAKAATAQWQLYYQKQAALQRELESYSLSEARDYAALFMKETAQ